MNFETYDLSYNIIITHVYIEAPPPTTDSSNKPYQKKKKDKEKKKTGNNNKNWKWSMNIKNELLLYHNKSVNID